VVGWKNASSELIKLETAKRRRLDPKQRPLLRGAGTLPNLKNEKVTR
jgi:hypothetical protein